MPWSEARLQSQQGMAGLTSQLMNMGMQKKQLEQQQASSGLDIFTKILGFVGSVFAAPATGGASLIPGTIGLSSALPQA
jgi:hypothetical protein